MKSFIRVFASIFALTSFMFFTILGFILSCKPSESVFSKTSGDTIFVETIRVDTITIIDRSVADSLSICLARARDSVSLYRDSIPYQDYINARRIEKIKYYISICDKKPTNKQFFFGWIKRTMSE